MTVDSRELFPAAYDEAFRAVMNHTYERFTFAGGRASAKSSFISLLLVLLLVRNPAFNALVLRKTANTLRRSVFEQVVWAIHKLGLEGHFKIPRSNTAALPITYTRADGGMQQILFTGCDDPEKLKSLKSAQGYFAILWIEEKTEFSQTELLNAKISTLRGGSAFWLFESYNPPSAVRHWCNAEARTSDPHRLLVKTTYLDLPSEWLGEAIIHDIEHTRATNERTYRNIFLGEATGTGLNVFENVRLEVISDEKLRSFDVYYNGIDWGYYPDPFHFVSCALWRDEVYVFDELRLYKASNQAAFEAVKEHMRATRLALGYTGQGATPDEAVAEERITADSAEPKSVADFRAYGGNVRAAVKGAGSRDMGYKWLQGQTAIVIDPVRCPKAADEFSLLEFETDKKTGEVLAGYPDGQPDHAIDAVRYALESVYRRKGA